MCTSITLKTNDKTVIHGRTNEFANYYSNDMVFYPVNYEIENSFLLKGTKKIERKYSYLGLTIGKALGENEIIQDPRLCLDGINKAGLSLSAHFYPGKAQYKIVKEIKDDELDLFGLIHMLLGNAKTVKDAEDILAKYQGKLVMPENMQPPGHIFLVDANGDSISVEPDVPGELTVLKANGIFTNSPNYKYHLQNLQSYSNVSQFDLATPSILTDENNKSVVSHGITGAFGVPFDSSPNSRFIKATYLRNSITKKNINTAEDGVTAMIRILNHFDFTPGFGLKYVPSENILENSVPTDIEGTISGHTDHTVYKDLTNGKMYYKDCFNQVIRYVDINEYDDKETEIHRINLFNDGAEKFVKVNLKK